MPQRRTLIVLGTLVGSMTLASALLLALEPAPIAPLSGIVLSSPVGRDAEPKTILFETTPTPQPDRWAAIVIHDSRTLAGSSRTINRLHERLNLGGLGYHFVITNGQGGPDGQIEVGFRWSQQLDGAHTAGPHAHWYNHNAIGICIIGDTNNRPPTPAQMQSLVWLVKQIQQRFQIPSDRVYPLIDSESASPLFPLAQFRRQLTAVTP